MSNIDKQELRLTAEKAKDNFMPNFMVPTRDLLALLDELEAKDSRIGELEVIAIDYGMKFQRAQDALKHQALIHKSQLDAAERAAGIGKGE